jgi:hypothetical protein
VEPEELEDIIPGETLRTLSENEFDRQRFVYSSLLLKHGVEVSSVRIIRKLIKNEERYIRDLDILSSVFLDPLYEAFTLSAFESLPNHIVELGNSHRRLLSALNPRRREDNSNQSIGDILLEASCEFRSVYPTYLGFLPSAEKK